MGNGFQLGEIRTKSVLEAENHQKVDIFGKDEPDIAVLSRSSRIKHL